MDEISISITCVKMCYILENKKKELTNLREIPPQLSIICSQLLVFLLEFIQFLAQVEVRLLWNKREFILFRIVSVDEPQSFYQG